MSYHQAVIFIAEWLRSLGWTYAGYFGGVLAIAVFCKVRPRLPHRHDGYVSINGYVWNCAVCDKPPAGLDAQLAEVRDYIAAHPWAGPYMGPDAR
jgi:hypothetical protein